MDGVGLGRGDRGDAVHLARTPTLDRLGAGSWLPLAAHGKAVGMPSDADMGNSEVGHNALGAGRIFDQGAKLVKNAVESGSLFTDETWPWILEPCQQGGTLHLVGLWSDGNVHSHVTHAYALLDSAVTSVKEGGLLLVTATDMAVLCGNNAEVAWAKYQSYPLRAKYCHEMAVRTLLAAVENAAIKHRRHIVPVISLSIDFYIRVFVRVYTSPLQMKQTPSKLSYVFQCVGCDAHELQAVGRQQTKGNVTKYQPGVGPVVPQRCSSCGWHYNMGGPIWSDPIHDKTWVTNVKSELERNKDAYPGYGKVHALLTMASEELLDVPLHYDLHAMGGTLKATPPSFWLFKSAVMNAGYRVSGSHSNPLAIKTDAPVDVLWDILRCWVKEHPVKPQSSPTPGEAILAKEPTVIANWTRRTEAQSKAQKDGVARFPQNPTADWGPKRRAGKYREEELEAKRRKEEEED